MRASASELRGLRLRAQGLADDRAPSATDAARRLLAVQAQDLPAARWALGVRTRAARDHDVTDALDSGALVRHWPLRGTLQLVAREDLRWLLGLTAERQWNATRRVREQWGVDDSVLGTAREASVAALAGGHQLTRAELSARLEAAGVTMTGGRGYQLIFALAITGTLVWAGAAGHAQRLALLDEWVPPAPELERGEALARLVGRYLAGHGPATPADIAWWAGVPMGWVNDGADAARAAALDVDGVRYLVDEAAEAPAARGVLLLPAFDEYLLGYRSREPVLAAEHAPLVATQANGRFGPLIVSAGRVVGVWRERGADIIAEPFDEASAIAPAALAPAIARYRRFRAAPG
jgi:hypothetical protein